MRALLASRSRIALLALAVVVLVGGFAAARVGLKSRSVGQAAQPAEEWTCPMHPDVHQSHPGQCPICGMTLQKKTAAAAAAAHDAAHEARAETANPARPGVSAPDSSGDDPRAPVELDIRRQQLLGVRLATVERAALTRAIRAPGVVKWDESRWTDVTLRLEGFIRDLYVNRTGQAVRRGQSLFTVYSPDVASALAEYRLALRARDALGPAVSPSAREQAARLVDAARARLDQWQISADQANAPESIGELRTVFRSPASGIVMEKMAVAGMRAMPGDRLYRIVDPSVVWVEASVYEPDLGVIQVGQHAKVTFDTFPGETFDGRVTFIAPTLDEETRTTIVRLELANRQQRLRPGMFASVDLVAPLGTTLVVPADAVLDSGRRQIVFVSDGDGYFTPRDITPGRTSDGQVQILRGLSAGERVAESGGFFIDSESQLRAALKGYEAATREADNGTARAKLMISLTTETDPVRTGPVALVVTAKGTDGQPVSDAAVSVDFNMAAMPSMNMPAMHSQASLSPAGNGTYRGSIDVLMAGRWDVTVTVTRGSERLGSSRQTVIAR
jgi:RND family efflux transporter MFP subunit